MGVRQNLPGSRPDGGPWPSGRTTVRQDFPKFSRRNLSCIRTSSERDGSIVRTDARPRQVISITGFARPDGFTSTRNFYIWCACVRTMRGRRPDGWSRIGSYHIRCTSVWTTAVRCSNGSFWTAILALRRYASGRDTTSSGRLIDLSFLELGKNQWTVRELIGVRTCCWNVRTEQVCTEASRYDVGARTEETSHPDRWCLSVWCPDGMTRRPEGWISRQMGVRTGWHIIQTADRELWNSSDFTLKSGIPVCHIITHKWFCPNTE
jgi:hypothetical protein